MSSTTHKICSKCGAHLVRRENVMTTSHPSQYIYDCPECGNVEYDIHKYPCSNNACVPVYSETIDYKDMHEAALRTAKQWIADGCTDKEKIALEAVFPELRESEDEKARKEIIGYLESKVATAEETELLYFKRWIAYLERQKEHQNNSGAREKALRGHLTFPLDKDKDLDDIAQDYVDGVKECNPEPTWDLMQTAVCYGYHYREQKEQIPYIDFVIKPHKGDDNNPYDMRVSEAQEYAIKRGFGIPYNDGEVYVDERHLTQTIGNILRWADEHPKEQQPAEWSKNDTVFLNEITDFFENKTGRLQHDLDMYAHWLKSLPQRFNFQPKPEWSEEDETRRKCCILYLANARDCIEFNQYIGDNAKERGKKEIQEDIEWLKFLRPQPKWKPSEEQMKELKTSCSYWQGITKAIPNRKLLQSLYDDLKKLMEDKQ